MVQQLDEVMLLWYSHPMTLQRNKILSFCNNFFWGGGRMDATRRLQRRSRMVYRFSLFVGGGSMIVAGLRWFMADDTGWLPPSIGAHVESGVLTMGQRFVGFTAELLPLAAVLFTLMALHRICKTYIRGELFSPSLNRDYKRFGSGLVFLGVANTLSTSLTIAAFSVINGSKELVLALGISTADLYLVVGGLTVLMLGLVMSEAHRLKIENEQFV
jgi:hypothetical protein